MRVRRILTCMGMALLTAGCAAEVGVPLAEGVAAKMVASPPALPAVGATAVYRVVNGYNGDELGQLRYRVDHAGGDWVVVAVTANSPYLGFSHREEYTAEGNWLHHPILNHDYPTDYRFAPPYPAYAFPLDIGKSWSSQVSATNVATGKAKSMRVYGKVAGGARISTPAGTFDTIRIVRTVYAGDAEVFITQTVTTETDWYAPSIGRAVRIERRSRWYDAGRGARWGANAVQGDWNVLELVGYAGN